MYTLNPWCFFIQRQYNCTNIYMIFRTLYNFDKPHCPPPPPPPGLLESDCWQLKGSQRLTRSLQVQATLWDNPGPPHFLIFNSKSKIQIPLCTVYFVPISVIDFVFVSCGFTTLKKLLCVVKISEQLKLTFECCLQSAVRSVKSGGPC